jgi:hypothetical protein
VRALLPALLLLGACTTEPGPLGDLEGNWSKSCTSSDSGSNKVRQVLGVNGSDLTLQTTIYSSGSSCSGDVAVIIEVYMSAVASGNEYPKNIDFTYQGATITPGTEAIAQSLTTSNPCDNPLLVWKAGKKTNVTGLNCGTTFGQMPTAGRLEYSIFSIVSENAGDTLTFGNLDADPLLDGSTSAKRPTQLRSAAEGFVR